MPTCGECEFFGDFVAAQFSNWVTTILPGGEQRYHRHCVGFDETQGAGCTCKDRQPQNVRIYNKTSACMYFQPRTWCRPDSCHNCSRCHGHTSGGGVLCDGWPFYCKEGDEPCQNGRGNFGEQLKLF